MVGTFPTPVPVEESLARSTSCFSFGKAGFSMRAISDFRNPQETNRGEQFDLALAIFAGRDSAN
jgi:hypothetical protein